MSSLIKGKYRDCLDLGVNRDEQQLVSNGEWKSNRIVTNSDILIASLMKGEANTNGILFLAIGSGEQVWDETNPRAVARTQQLSNEIYRHRMTTSEIIYLDDLAQPSRSPTRRIGINVNLIGSELVESDFLSLREFGLYGGDATSAANSGLLINYVIHPRIDLTVSATLNRQLILTFDGTISLTDVDDLPIPPVMPIPSVPNNEELPIERSPQWLQESPIIIIDGVGASYAQRLESAGISTLIQLSTLETAELDIDFPAMKLVELKSKATLALQTMANISLNSSLQGSLLRELMSTSVQRLAISSGESELRIRTLLAQFGRIQMVLDNRFLEGKSLVEIITGE